MNIKAINTFSLSSSKQKEKEVFNKQTVTLPCNRGRKLQNQLKSSINYFDDTHGYFQVFFVNSKDFALLRGYRWKCKVQAVMILT